MKVFISWSGDRSHKVAQLLSEWLQCVLQAVNPWLSSSGIDKGALWFPEIAGQLQGVSLGIICLTSDNKDKPWILFESGALMRGLTSSRVLTLLIDVEPHDIDNPLAQFNHTMPDEQGMRAFIHSLNSRIEDRPLPEKILDQVFEKYWPDFKAKFDQVLAENPPSEPQRQRSDESMIDEILNTVRSLDRRIRLIESDKRPLVVGRPLGYEDWKISENDLAIMQREMDRRNASTSSGLPKMPKITWLKEHLYEEGIDDGPEK